MAEAVRLTQHATEDVTVDPASPRILTVYLAQGSTDLAEVLLACRRQDAPPAGSVRVPPVLRGLLLVGLDPQHNGGGVWTVTARYGVFERGATPAPGVGPTPGPGAVPALPPGVSPPPPPAEPGANTPLGREYRVSTGGGTETKRVSISTRDSKKAAWYGGTTPDYRNAINVGKDGVVGCEVTSRKLDISITRQFQYLTRDYILDVYRQTGTVNNAPFMGFEGDAEGFSEVLFVGAEMQGRDDGAWNVTFHFTVSPNRYAEVVIPHPSSPQTADIGGWDYVWWTFLTEVSNGVTVQWPQFAFVESVYVCTSFDNLRVFG